MLLKIRTLDNSEAEVDAEGDEPLSTVKTKIASVFPRLAPSQQLMLIHRGKILNAESKVSDYEMKDGDLIVVMVPKVS